MIDVEALRTRYRRIAGFLDERGRRLFAANEALALGRGGVTAVSAASGIARSTINRGIAELRAGSNELGEGVRRRGGGRKSAVVLQPGLLSALEELIEGAIRGDPQSPLRWVSRSQRNIATALRQQGFAVSQSWSVCYCASWTIAVRPTARPAKARNIPTAMRSSSISMPG